MNWYFTRTDPEPDGSTITVEFSAADLQTVLDHFHNFLRGCGMNPDPNLFELNKE